jgi:high-affinity nickel-transport protein
VVGTIEVLGLVSTELGGLHSALLASIANVDINKAGFVIVGMFVVCWAGALAFWRLGRVEERWGAGLRRPDAVADAADAAS